MSYWPINGSIVYVNVWKTQMLWQGSPLPRSPLRTNANSKPETKQIYRTLSRQWSETWSLSRNSRCTLQCIFQQPVMKEQCFSLLNTLLWAKESAFSIKIYLHWKKLFYTFWLLKVVHGIENVDYHIYDVLSIVSAKCNLSCCIAKFKSCLFCNSPKQTM